MNKQELEASYPSLAAELRTEGATAERERIRAVETSREGLDSAAKKYMVNNPGVSYVAAYKAVGGK